MDFTPLKTRSANLSKNLEDCEEVILFSAALGTEVDLLLRRYAMLHMSKAVIMQAAVSMYRKGL